MLLGFLSALPNALLSSSYTTYYLARYLVD